MARLFDRKVRLTMLPDQGTTIIVDKLRMSLSCQKSVESTPNSLRLSVYNLNPSNRNLLESERMRISLEAGYVSTIAVIFVGNIERVTHRKNRGDIITKIEAKDGGNRYRNAKIERSYGPGVRSDFVIRDLANEFGLQLSEFVDLPATQYANGLSLSGLIRDELTNILRKSDHEWSIQNETLQIIPRTKTTNEGIVLLNFETGLIKRPTKTKKGINFTSFLQPELKPGNKVKIEADAESISGLFKLKTVVHQGDSNEGTWESVCEAFR